MAIFFVSWLIIVDGRGEVDIQQNKLFFDIRIGIVTSFKIKNRNSLRSFIEFRKKTIETLSNLDTTNLFKWVVWYAINISCTKTKTVHKSFGGILIFFHSIEASHCEECIFRTKIVSTHSYPQRSDTVCMSSLRMRIEQFEESEETCDVKWEEEFICLKMSNLLNKNLARNLNKMKRW